ncbi:MAG: phosphoribosylformylglycinamidine synthase I [Verrucomicrobiota bacterium]
MEERAHAVLLTFPGTNCDEETARALRAVGFAAEVVPVTQLTPSTFESAQLVVLSGGFSYGDYIMAGRLAQLELQRRIGDALKAFVAGGGYALGICNGFQILTKLGLLPEGSLIDNASGRFQCQWVGLKKQSARSPYLSALPDKFELPVAHAEGRFVAVDPEVAEGYLGEGLVALTYAEDVNGSSAGIAGLQDETRRVLGLMPHPERFLYLENHYDPDWSGHGEWGWGYFFFKGIYDAIATEGAVAPA